MPVWARFISASSRNKGTACWRNPSKPIHVDSQGLGLLGIEVQEHLVRLHGHRLIVNTYVLLFLFQFAATYVIKRAGMSQSKSGKEIHPAGSSECPVCYEAFQSPKVSRRKLSCGHTFCHDCLVKCLLASQDEGRLQNTLTCPICRFVTFLCKTRSCWPSKPALHVPSRELPLSPSSLPCGVSLGPSNTLVVPSHFVMSFNSYENQQSVYSCPSIMQTGAFDQEPHIFIITQCGMPLLEESYSMETQNHEVEAPGSVASSRSLGIKSCFHSPIMLAIFLVSAVALLGAVLPWLLLVRENK